MNKQFIIKLGVYFNDTENRDKLFYIIFTNLKKFKISKKKRFFIRYNYPHRRSESHYKSFVTIKKYLTKHKKWYTAKKKCLRFNNFEKLFPISDITLNSYNEVSCFYTEE